MATVTEESVKVVYPMNQSGPATIIIDNYSSLHRVNTTVAPLPTLSRLRGKILIALPEPAEPAAE